jgi:hypothetical protein
LRVCEDVTGLSASERREIECNAGTALDALVAQGLTSQISVEVRQDGEY